MGEEKKGDIFEEALLTDSMIISDAHEEGYSLGYQEKCQELFKEGFEAGFQMSIQLANLANNLLLNCPKDDARLRNSALSIALLLSDLKLENSDESAHLLEKIMVKYKLFMTNSKAKKSVA